MSYKKSAIDNSNFKWFENDKTCNSLVGIKISNGNIRGIFPCEISFKYPISAFVGENGSGKSTILALSACAFHNTEDFHQFSRKKSYFTYGDFFTFSPAERGLQGIEILYRIRQIDGDIVNLRRKKPSGKWNDFHTRKNRRVIYLGINRIVPPSESSAHRSYKNSFSMEEIPQSVLEMIRNMAGRIFGRNYSDLKIFIHNTYRLYLVKRNAVSYSGFNMGAGENAVISILLELLLAGPGALMVIDEIELGLHAKAQHEFIEVLKEICKDSKCQIICSTHSEIVLNAIPPEGRFFVQNQGNSTIITPEISPDYAFGRLAGQNSQELDIFVEDDVGQEIISNIIPMRIRERVKIYTIGSDEAILKQVASRYRENKNNFICFFDGDKRNETHLQIDRIRKHLETRIPDEADFKNIVASRLCYLPGDTWPEANIVQSIMRIEDKKELSNRWDVLPEEITPYLEQALVAPKHEEFYTLAERLSMDKKAVMIDCIKFFKNTHDEIISEVCSKIDAVLSEL